MVSSNAPNADSKSLSYEIANANFRLAESKSSGSYNWQYPKNTPSFQFPNAHELYCASDGTQRSCHMLALSLDRERSEHALIIQPRFKSNVVQPMEFEASMGYSKDSKDYCSMVVWPDDKNAQYLDLDLNKPHRKRSDLNITHPQLFLPGPGGAECRSRILCSEIISNRTFAVEERLKCIKFWNDKPDDSWDGFVSFNMSRTWHTGKLRITAIHHFKVTNPIDTVNDRWSGGEWRHDVPDPKSFIVADVTSAVYFKQASDAVYVVPEKRKFPCQSQGSCGEESNAGSGVVEETRITFRRDTTPLQREE